MKNLVYTLLIISLMNQQVKAQEAAPQNKSNASSIVGLAVIAGAITTWIIVAKIKKNKKKKIEAENSLQGKKVKELAISYGSENVTHTLGSSFNMIIKATLEDGKELVTDGAGKGLTQWSDYVIEADGATFENGILTINRDMKAIKNNKVVITASVKSDPSITKQFEIPLQYDGDMFGNFAGYCGRSGKSGYHGGGLKSPGEGEKGNNGGDADDGEDGGDGQQIEVYAKVIKSADLNKDLLYVKVKSLSADKEGLYIVDPAKAKITVSANGGCGGNGGRGGGGGPGGSSTGNGGNGGNGGKGGNGANGGNGGRITLFLDPSAVNYSSAIILTNDGGSGGSYGSGGAVGSGGNGNVKSGNQGIYGKDGSRSGRDGSKGAAPTIETKSIEVE